MARLSFIIVLLVGWAGAPAFAQTEPGDGAEPILATDLFKIRQIDEVAFSPDQRQILYSVKSVVKENGDTTEAVTERDYHTHLYVVQSDGSELPRQLTRGDESATQPDWHPSGDKIAFTRNVNDEPQVFVLPMDGGEAYQVTDMEHGAGAPRWSPDGDWLMFSSSLPHDELRDELGGGPGWEIERPGRSSASISGANADPNGSLGDIRAWLTTNAENKRPRVFTRLDFQGEYDLEPRSAYRHLFVMRADPDAEPRRITDGFRSYSGGAWLPGGEAVVFSGPPGSDLHPDRIRLRNLFVAGRNGSDQRTLLQMDGYRVFAPRPAPNSDHIAFLAQRLSDAGYAQTEVGVYSSEDGASLLTLEFDRSPGSLRWSPDGWYLYFTAAADGGFPLYRRSPFAASAAGETAVDSMRWPAISPDTAAVDTTVQDVSASYAPAVERITSYARGVRSFDVGRSALAYVITQATNPYELYASTPAGTNELRLTSHNAEWLENKRLSLPDAYTVVRDSLEIDYWVMRPSFFDDEASYPMLLEIHGGPMAMWGPGKATMWHEFQYFAAQGYGIVYSNPRGSGGYGYAFKRENYRDWGAGPAQDVLAAAEAALARHEWLDAGQQVVTGGSYAGYLTAWIVAHTDRFQAAVAQRGVYDLTTFLGEGNAWRLVPWHFGGYPWTRNATEVMPSSREVLARNSPLTYVAQIRTPLLIIHADNDLRTGVIQSEMLYKSLKILERPVEYIRYPDSGHDLSRTGKPTLRLDRLLRIYEFMERFVR